MGLYRKSRHATLGALPCLETAGETSQILTGFFVLLFPELRATRTFVHAVERVFPRAGPSGENHQRREFRGVLLHLFQSEDGWDYGDLFPCEK